MKIVRQKIGSAILTGLFESSAFLTSKLPISQPERFGVEVIRDIPYTHSGLKAHNLDVYRPQERHGKLPVIFFIHGGGFRILSKETHWLMAMNFAKAGYVVFTINYRLAPKYPFPAAVEDAAAAYCWMVSHAHEYDGDVDNIVVTGESAGANLSCVLTVAATYEREEYFCKNIWDTGAVPKAVMPFCGVLEVENWQRYIGHPQLNLLFQDRLETVYNEYTKGIAYRGDVLRELANPLVILETQAPSRPLPPFFAPVGGADFLEEDCKRLQKTLHDKGVYCDVPVYPGEPHAFHAMIWRENARKCWQDTFRFLDAVWNEAL